MERGREGQREGPRQKRKRGRERERESERERERVRAREKQRERERRESLTASRFYSSAKSAQQSLELPSLSQDYSENFHRKPQQVWCYGLSAHSRKASPPRTLTCVVSMQTSRKSVCVARRSHICKIMGGCRQHKGIQGETAAEVEAHGGPLFTPMPRAERWMQRRGDN